MRATLCGRFQRSTITSAMIDAVGPRFVSTEAAGPLEQQHLQYASYRAVANSSKVSGRIGTSPWPNDLGWGFDGMNGGLFELLSPLIRSDAEDGARKLLTLVRERTPKRFRFDPVRDIQVLCPMNRGGPRCSLNIELQRDLNPLRESRTERFGWTARATRSCSSRKTTTGTSTTAISVAIPHL